MDREGFRNRLKQYKQAREENPGLKYWEWKNIPKYDEGGKVIPTQEEYIAEQIAARKAAALEKSLSRTMPRVPQGIKTGERWNPVTKKVEDIHECGPSCAYTFSDNYGQNWMGSEDFKQNHANYGWKQVPWEQRQPGNAVLIVDDSGTAKHTMMYDSDNAQGQPLFNHSNGGHDESAIRKKAKYPHHNPYLTYEFVGTPADSTQWINDYKKIYGFAEGGEVEEPGLWDKFTNTVNVLYNNAARKVKSFFTDDQTGEVIDLTNKNVSRITPNTDNLTAIYGNEFVENNANNIRTRKQFEETTDTLIGDKRIPLSRISNFYGIENGKLKAGDLSTFDENTVVIPNRAKKTGKIKEIIFTEPLSEHKIDSLRRVNRQEQSAYHMRLKEFADSLGMDYGSNKFTQLFYGSPYSNLLDRYRKAIRNDSDQEFVKKYNELKKMSPRQMEALNQLRHGNISYVTESNDTIRMANTAMPAFNKTIYADELGNSLFVNNTKNLSKEQQDYVNEKLKVTPMYPILIDNGRYQHYQTEFPNYNTYTSFDFNRDPKNMYVIGTTK